MACIEIPLRVVARIPGDGIKNAIHNNITDENIGEAVLPKSCPKFETMTPPNANARPEIAFESNVNILFLFSPSVSRVWCEIPSMSIVNSKNVQIRPTIAYGNEEITSFPTILYQRIGHIMANKTHMVNRLHCTLNLRFNGFRSTVHLNNKTKAKNRTRKPHKVASSLKVFLDSIVFDIVLDITIVTKLFLG